MNSCIGKAAKPKSLSKAETHETLPSLAQRSTLRRVVFSFVTVSRASLFLYVRVTVSSLVLSFLFSGFYIRLLHCAEFPLTHARNSCLHINTSSLRRALSAAVLLVATVLAGNPATALWLNARALVART